MQKMPQLPHIAKVFAPETQHFNQGNPGPLGSVLQGQCRQDPTRVRGAAREVVAPQFAPKVMDMIQGAKRGLAIGLWILCPSIGTTAPLFEKDFDRGTICL